MLHLHTVLLLHRGHSNVEQGFALKLPACSVPFMLVSCWLPNDDCQMESVGTGY